MSAACVFVMNLWHQIDRPERVVETILAEDDHPSVDIYIVTYSGGGGGGQAALRTRTGACLHATPPGHLLAAVDLIHGFSPAESVEIVKPTMFAALNLQWPYGKLTVYVCDDGRRAAMREMVESAHEQLKQKGRCGIIAMKGRLAVIWLTCTCVWHCRHVDLRYTARDKVKGVPHHGEAWSSCLPCCRVRACCLPHQSL